MITKWHILPLLLLTASLHANATITTTGALQYDDVNGIITSTNDGTQYLGWDVLKDYTYAQTVTATSASGLYEEWSIASQTQAYAFFHDAGGQGNDAVGSNEYRTAVSFDDDGIPFGNSHDNQYDYVWFLSDESTNDVGFVEMDVQAQEIIVRDSWSSISISDNYSSSGSASHTPVSWLLIRSVAEVPEPPMLALMVLGFLGMFGLKRRQFRA